ncbi:MAG: thiamine pyrophosphate-dependent enzyme [Anaerolineae bacterium]|jgi:pyruvate ferredoxin oxidoreductase beta subunit|nr:thiamine pyrophosphate-dependent enzyme [Anaerolineae bacterium]MDH7475531.1 thiamine pyrophosphate-dependent enzyme [Anaerolineae bacterium]
MAIKLKELAGIEERLTSGHRLCAGCAESIIIRQIVNAIEEPIVIATATGCTEIATSVYPWSSWRVPWIHSAFENAATTAAGAEAMYRSLVRQGKIEDKNIKFLAIGGDGATYDIGLQWISGVFERGHKVIYICLNNEAYMNTGIQRSSATPLGAHTTTSPAGEVIPGKTQWRKPLTKIMAAHDIPYVAQASPHRWRDLMEKAQKAVEADGPAFLNVISPCPRGWRHDSSLSIEVAKMAVETCYWPLYEVRNGSEWTLNYKPKEKLPVTEWLKMQGRFRHLFTPQFEYVIEELQAKVDEEWDKLLALCGEK